MTPTSSERSGNNRDSGMLLKRCIILGLGFVILPLLLKYGIVREERNPNDQTFFRPLGVSQKLSRCGSP